MPDYRVSDYREVKAAIVGVAGLYLTARETALLRAYRPAGAVLFARNVDHPAQLQALIAALRRVLPPGGVVMVDQEGGRVARLRAPHWLAHPPAGELGRLFAATPMPALRAAWLTGALIGLDCAQAGFDVVAAPVLDVASRDGHEVVGDRAFSADPATVARLGRALAQGLLAAGVQPIAKHAPGHGQAQVDSHIALPHVHGDDLGRDTMPFALNAGMPWAMTAHILYTALDADHPATQSATIIERVIRGQIGFRGVLVTDDLAMQALSGSPGQRALAALRAGCDLALYCSGEIDANEALLGVCPEISSPTAVRLLQARRVAASHRIALNPASLLAERQRLLA